MVDAVAHILLYQRTDPEVLDISSTSPAGVNAYDVYLDAEGDWDLLDVLPSGEIDIHSSLLAEFTALRDKCVEHSVEASKTAANVLKLALRDLSTIKGQRELLARVNRLHNAIR